MIEPVLVASLGVVASAAVEAATRYWRGRAQSNSVEVVTENGEVLLEPADVKPSIVRSAAPTVTVKSAQLSVEDVVRIVQATRSSEGSGSWLAKHGATLLVGVIAAAATIFTALAPEDPTPADCVAYIGELASLKTAFPDAEPDALFGADGIRFGAAEAECGPPESFFSAVE